MIETFDFIEFCCGPDEADGSPPPLSVAVAHSGLHVGPRNDLKQHPFWDLGSFRVLECLFLVGRGRLWLLHTAAPCTTFSIARCPRLRTKTKPEGFDPRESGQSDSAPDDGGVARYSSVDPLSWVARTPEVGLQLAMGQDQKVVRNGRL